MLTQEYSLLAEIALRLARSPEDVATEGLAYVLARSEGARAIVQSLAADWAAGPLRRIASFRSQVGAGDDSRPDLEALDSGGVPVVIFENKFWASLTDAQPVSYLRRLKGHGGILCFVAPTTRLPFLWPEVTERAAAAFGSVQPVRNEQELKLARVDENRVLALTSWAFLLGQIRTALETQGDLSLAADVRQLIGLAARMETSGFVPLTVADLTAPTARHVLQFCQIVNVVVENLLREPFASKKGLKASAGEGWYGHYLRLHGLGCQLSFDAQMWAQYGRSPVWLRVTSPSWRYSEPVERAMAEHLGTNGYVALRDGYWAGVWTPIGIPEGRELDAVVESIRQKLIAIANVLQHVKLTGTTEAMPPEPEAG